MTGDKILKIIGILGSDHACTTLAGCMLGSTPTFGDIFHIGECHAYFSRSWKFWQGRDYKPHCATEQPCKMWDRISAKTKPEEAYATIAANTGCGTIIDSSKTPAWFSHQLPACHDKGWPIHFLLFWRPVTDLAHSFWSRANRLQPVAYEMTREQLIRLEKILVFEKKHGLSLTVVNGNKLVQQPAVMLEKLCTITGIPYFPGKEEYWKFEHHHLYGGITQRKHLNRPRRAGFTPRERAVDFPAKYFAPLEQKHHSLLSELEARSL